MSIKQQVFMCRYHTKSMIYISICFHYFCYKCQKLYTNWLANLNDSQMTCPLGFINWDHTVTLHSGAITMDTHNAPHASDM